ncbi:hypothetical protein GCM10011374_36410 [Kocuria dechangensis]|uniref:Uncharacterized protein n=1 Tax=Kocuria dechangensis TaxID=1176249 RepID=A0A917H681_9MICC|nr:hypothetical protein [Kocuria dechangensis]GGG68705.1 hypothetical protein GCM10011374_36410 [Kocuria dechangensis]
MTTAVQNAVPVQGIIPGISFQTRPRARVRPAASTPAHASLVQAHTVLGAGSGPYEITIEELKPAAAREDQAADASRRSRLAPLARFTRANMVGAELLRIGGGTGRAELRSTHTYFTSGTITIDGTLTVLEGERADGSSFTLQNPLLVRATIDRRGAACP